jgi:hypothetical protein
MSNGFDEIERSGREAMNQTVVTIGAFSRAWEGLAQQTLAFSRESFTEGATHLEKLVEIRSLERAAAVQVAFVTTAYEKATGRAVRLGELYLDLLKEVAKPLEGTVARHAQ